MYLEYCKYDSLEIEQFLCFTLFSQVIPLIILTSYCGDNMQTAYSGQELVKNQNQMRGK